MAADVLTLDEAAAYLKVSTSTLYKLLQSGRIPARKLGRRWRFAREDLEAWLRGPQGEGAASRAPSPAAKAVPAAAAVVQPVWDRHCVSCHGPAHPKKLDLTATLDADRIPASYRTLIQNGLVHYLDYQYNAGGNEKRPPLSFGVLHSRLVKVLEAGHQKVALSADEWQAVKCWIDLNCPLWPDYLRREDRPGPELATGK